MPAIGVIAVLSFINSFMEVPVKLDMDEFKIGHKYKQIATVYKKKQDRRLIYGRRLSYLLPPLIVAAVLLAVYFLKGIYPFGSLTVVYGDMDQHYIPFSYHIYDVFHSGKSLFWDPYLGTGSNIFGIEALSGMFSPISWLVVFTSRENIPYFASFLLMIRMMFLSVASFVFMNRTFRGTRAFWRVALSVMYAFCGYVLIFYTNMVWIDCAILFPLLLLSLKALFDKGRILGYLAVLSANLIISYYISFMLLLFVFFSSGIFLFFYIEKSRRKKVLLNLGAGTIGALLLTSFVTVPAFLQSASSIRFDGFSYLGVIGADASASVAWNKADFFFFGAISLVVFFKIFWNYRTNKRMATAFGLLMGLTVSQVIVEATNILWYGGSYVCYPLRFGFIPLFLLLVGTAWYLSPGFHKKSDESPPGTRTPSKEDLPPRSIRTRYGTLTIPVVKRIKSIKWGKIHAEVYAKSFSIRLLHWICAGIALAAYFVAVYLGSTFGAEINRTLYGYWGISVNLSVLFLITTILFGIALWILLKLKEKNIKYVLIAFVLLTEIFMHSMWYIGVPPRTEGHLDDWSIVANELHDNLTINNSTISRFKDADSALNANYPLVMGVQSVSSYLHLIEARQQNAFELLGYSNNYTRLLDTGGTLFSDMVLNVNQFLTSTPYDQDFFDLLGKSNDLYIYKNKYALPVGIVIPTPSGKTGSLDNLDFIDDTTPLNNQNMMYQAFFHQTDSIIDLIESTPTLANLKMNQDGEQLHCEVEDVKKTGSLEYEFSVTGENYVYFGARNVSNQIHIMVNGETIAVPTFGSLHNTSFPASYNNGILNLGLYENESVKVQIVISGAVDFGSLSIGTLSLEKLKVLSTQSISQNNSNTVIKGKAIHITTTSEQAGQSLFLPVNYDRGWECTINGNPVIVGKVFGTFIRLDLAEGQNEIELQFIPYGFKPGILISGITLLLGIMALFILKRKKVRFFISKNNTETSQAIIISINSNVWLKGIKNKILIGASGVANAIYIIFWTAYFAALLFIYIIPLLSFLIRSLTTFFITVK